MSSKEADGQGVEEGKQNHDDGGGEGQKVEQRAATPVQVAKKAPKKFPIFTDEGNVHTLPSRIASLDQSLLPHSYRSNSTKEELCLEYVENFRRQFISLFPQRQPLLLFPKNECGVRKFVCTTVRPTQLRYREIYDLEACAEFVAGFLEFEPLAEPLKIPATLPSPSMIIAQQVSDSFGFAMVLASLLLGAGFDAYVVCGYAPRWITMRDQTDVLCPVIEKERVRRSAIEKESSSSKSAGGSDTATTGAGGTGTAGSHYDIKPHGVPNSSFIEMLASRKREAEEARKRWLKAQGDADLDVGRPEPESKTDPHWGKRVHAWVMVAPPKRKVKDFMFVEPTTGEVYSHDDSPYLGIESMWNHQNYWVNMQPMDQPMSKISFDLGNAENWEYVFIDTTKRAAEKRGAEASREGDGAAAGGDDGLGAEGLGEFSLGGSSSGDGSGIGSDSHSAGAGANGGAGGKQSDDVLDDDEAGEQILDLPPSWVTKLSIDRERFSKRYTTTGFRQTLYRRAKHELYAENTHESGLVSRVSLYKDLARTIPEEIREEFRNRKDKLHRRIRRPLDCVTHEMFLPGRPLGLKEMIDTPGRRRECLFYINARMDGLKSRVEVIGKSMTEVFEDRLDKLQFRKVEVDRRAPKRSSGYSFVLPCGHLGDLPITKMTQSFGKSIAAAEAGEKQLARSSFYILEDRAVMDFHYSHGRITAKSNEYFKDETTGPDYSAKFKGNDPGHAEDEVAAVWQQEKDCYQEIRNSERQVDDILKHRKIEEARVQLVRSVFETARERAKREAEGMQKEAEADQKEEENPLHVKYLTPFLSQFPNPGKLSKEEADRARKACLGALKDRLLERANIIQGRLDTENANLAKRQAAFQRTRDRMEGSDEAFEQFCSKAMFRIQILEQRLARHEETALQKYADMDESLRHDPRLS